MVLDWISQYGYVGIFCLLTLGIVGLPIPDETLLTFVGYLAFKGNLHVLPTIAVSVCGSMFGITLSYLLGRTGGVHLVARYGHVLHITPAKMERARNWFQRVGKWSLLFGYFIPGLRHLNAYVAGTAELRYRFFALFAYTGAVIWATTFIAIGYFVSEHWRRAEVVIHRGLLTGLAAAVAAGSIYLVVFRSRRHGNSD
jgi:membrane protein DedA with SNARE-associated domain